MKRSIRWIAAACASAMLVSVTAGTSATAATGGDAGPPAEKRATQRLFPDVSPTSPFADAINWLADAGVTGGYSDGGFHPADGVTRQAMAAFLHRYDQATTSGADPGFNDVPSTHPFAEEIWWLADEDITGGYSDGGFHPGGAITRQAMAAFLYRYRGGMPGAPDPGFNDVPSTHPFAQEIWWLAETGLTGGYSDGGFHPSDRITRQAMAAFLHRLAGEPAVGVPGVNRVDTDVAFVVDGDTATSNVANGDGTGTLVLAAGTTPAPVIGEIVVLDSTETIPEGALGTVTSVSAAPGGITVEYGPATVEQAVPDADIEIAQELFNAGSGSQVGTGGAFDLNGTDCNGVFTTNLGIDAGASLDFRANWGPSSSDRVFRLALNLNASATATANADLNLDCHMDFDLDTFIPPIPLPAIPLPGPLPPIIPTLEWTATLDAKGGTDITFTGTAGFTGRYGAEFVDGKAGLINETTTNGSASLTATNPAGEARAFAGPMVRFNYVGILNGIIEAGPFVEGEFDWLDGGFWSIRGGLEAAASIGADLWLLGSYTWSSPRLTLWSQTLSSGGIPVAAENELMSGDSVGLEANARVYLDGVSADGHQMLFHSAATNLPGGDGSYNYWLQDLDDGDSAPILVPGLNYASTAITPILTADGNEVIFQSVAGLDGGPVGTMAVYVLNIGDATIEWLSEVPPGLIAGPLVGGASVIATDRGGRFLLFRVTENISPDCRVLFSGGTDCYMPHYLRLDRWTGEVFDAWWGSETLPGYLGGVAYDDKSATIDHTGRYAVITGNYGHFAGYTESTAKYGSSNFAVAYLLDMVGKEIFIVSEQGNLVPANGQVVGGPHISDSGRHVVFASDASNLGIGDTNSATDIYRRDIFDDNWRRASIDATGGQLLTSSTDPSISANGQLVTFQNSGTLGGLVPAGAYVRDVEAGATCEVAVGYNDTTPDALILRAIISDVGYTIAFATDATNMIGVSVPIPNAYRVFNRCL